MLLTAYVCCSSSILMIDLVGISGRARQEDSAPSAHECLKPLEVDSLLIDDGRNGFYFGHHAKDKLQYLFRVLLGCGGQVQEGRRAVSVRDATQAIRTLRLVNRW